MMVPMPPALVALTWPPWRVTIAFTIDSPSPLPGEAIDLDEDAL
jgi:hypothetical protein